MIKYEIQKKQILISFPRDHSLEQRVMTQEINGCLLRTNKLDALLDSFTSLLTGLESTNEHRIRLFFVFIGFLSSEGLAIPQTQQAWQSSLLFFFRYYFSNSKSQAGIRSRKSFWRDYLATPFRRLQALGAIPSSVVIPCTKNLREVSASSTTGSNLIGQVLRRRIGQPREIEKLIVKIDPYATDEAYLDQVQESIEGAIDELRNICSKHFYALENNRILFNDIGKHISDEKVAYYLENKDWYYTPDKSESRGVQVHRLNVSYNNGMSLWFALIRYLLNNPNSDPQCLDTATLVELGVFPCTSNVSRSLSRLKEAIQKYSHFETSVFKNKLAWRTVLRHVGIMQPCDIYALAALLIMDNPKLNSESLLRAKVLNVRGKSLLMLTDNADKLLFSVDKPRAGSRKYTVLGGISKKIIEFILEVTNPLRKILKLQNSSFSRYLFLTVTPHRGISFPFEKVTLPGAFSGKGNNISLSDLYPSTQCDFLDWQANVNLSSIRNTMGVLKWFETGSIEEMSRTLGNKKRTTIEHYLPPQLLRLWSARIIRRFQNTLILLACHDESWLMDAVDFTTPTQMKHFICQLLFSYEKGSSPIADEIHKCFGESSVCIKDGITDSTVKILRHGNIRLSSNALAALYAFADPLTQRYSNDVDSLYFIELAQMLHHGLSNKEIISQICSEPSDKVMEIQKRALNLAPKWQKLMNNAALTHGWGDIDE